MTANTIPTDQTSVLGRIDCPVLVTERLVLRAPVDDDIPDLVRLANNRAISEMTSTMPFPYGEADARAFLGKVAEPGSPGCKYICTLADTGTLVGGAGIDDRSDGPEIGYWIGQPHWGNGFASEIAHAIIDLAFRATTIDSMIARCRIDNPASRRVLEKNGFEFTHEKTCTSLVAGPMPSAHYRLEREKWMNLRAAPGKALGLAHHKTFGYSKHRQRD